MRLHSVALVGLLTGSVLIGGKDVPRVEDVKDVAAAAVPAPRPARTSRGDQLLERRWAEERFLEANGSLARSRPSAPLPSSFIRGKRRVGRSGAGDVAG
jgi:hypothetical protein